MGIIAGIIILLILVSAIPKDKERTYTYRPPRKGHYEQIITGYKLRRNVTYSVLKKYHGFSDQQLGYMQLNQYDLIPQYGQIWIPE